MRILLILMLFLCSCAVRMRKMDPIVKQNVDFRGKTVLIYRSSLSDQYISDGKIKDFKSDLEGTNLFGQIETERTALEYDYYIDFKFIHQDNICDKFCLFLADLRAIPSLIFPFWYDEHAGYAFAIYDKDHIKIADINTIGKTTYIDWSFGFILRVIPGYANNESRYLKNALLMDMQK